MTATQAALAVVPRRGTRRRALLLCAAAVLALFTYLFPTTDNANVTSRLATAESLVERHTFRIDDSSFVSTIDKVYVRGHFYSEKPPLLAVLAAAVYYPLHAAGFDLRPDSEFVPCAIAFLLVGLSFLACLACFHDALGRVGLPEPQAARMTVMLAFGTTCLPFSTTFNNHGFTASWIFVGFCGLLRAQCGTGALACAPTEAREVVAHAGRSRPSSEGVGRWMWLSGTAFALAVAADYSTALFFVVFLAYALARPQLRAGVYRLLIPALLALGASLAYNYAISGSLRPVQIQPGLFRYPGSYWLNSTEHLSGVGYNSPAFTVRYGVRALFGPNGFLLYNPMLLAAIGAACRQIWKRGRLWVEAAVALGASATFMTYYLVSTTNYSGCSYSIRWFVSFVPLLWFFAYPLFADWTARKRLVLGGLFAASLVIATVGVVNPWSCRKPAFFGNIEMARYRATIALEVWRGAHQPRR